METVLISAKLSDKKKTEFYQTMEPLESLVKSKCIDYQTIITENGNLVIEILFENQKQLEKNFFDDEFNILKGSLKSLCDDVHIQMSN